MTFDGINDNLEPAEVKESNDAPHQIESERTEETYSKRLLEMPVLEGKWIIFLQLRYAITNL